MKNDTYISAVQDGKCRACGLVKDLRLGYCWGCAEAETIILNGNDMYDKGEAKTAMDKLKMLISKGWVRKTSLD